MPVAPQYLANEKKNSDVTHSDWSRAIKTMVAESCSATEQARGMAVITLGWGMGYVLPCAVGQGSVFDCILETCCEERRDGGRCSVALNASPSDLTVQARLSVWLSAQKNLRCLTYVQPRLDAGTCTTQWYKLHSRQPQTDRHQWCRNIFGPIIAGLLSQPCERWPDFPLCDDGNGLFAQRCVRPTCP